ncbi:hypothetical protein PVAP13_1NG027036 [Panicum virgatum]|uniref:Uncharacterized protein n=1 Tax=Panicum virgatum TaxID=38727 RepID=A0A8T0WI05_PANVG|nr:hypothetical protein PVAP13_1NG027036 [Panicum virgatum]
MSRDTRDREAASIAVVMRRAARVAVAASARIHATTVSSLCYLSLLCFPLLIKPRLGFCRSISRPILARPQFLVRFPPAPQVPACPAPIPACPQFSVRFPPAPRVPACPARVPVRHPSMATASSPRTPSDRLVPQADALRLRRTP